MLLRPLGGSLVGKWQVSRKSFKDFSSTNRGRWGGVWQVSQ